MRALILILMIIFTINAFALETPKTVKAILAYGGEFRSDKNIQGDATSQNFTNFAVGGGYGKWIGLIERASFEEVSGNASLNLKRSYEDIMLWGHYRPVSWNRIAPFVGGGAGFYKEKVDTSLVGTTTSNSSKNKLLAGGSFGLSLDIPIAWLSVEGRLLFGEELERQPTLGALLRAGVYF